MIQTKEDLRRYMEADKRMLERGGVCPGPVDYVWKFERLLRRSEYWHNCSKTPLSMFWSKFLSLRLARMEARLGFSIPLNVFGSGLSIAHIGPIIVSPHARIGRNCRIHVGVNIGTRAGVPMRPQQSATTSTSALAQSCSGASRWLTASPWGRMPW